MKVYKVKDYETMSQKAAAFLAAKMILKPDALLGLATGSTPIGTYKRLVEMYQKKEYQNPACIVDANHSNSGKQYKEQIRIVKEVLHSCRHSQDVNRLIKGVMIESYIEEGCQKISDHVYGKSITDPCLGWEDSERLLCDMADLL